MARLESAHDKLSRAKEHLRTLETDMAKKLGAKKYTITQQAHTQITDVGSYTVLDGMELLKPPKLPSTWSLLIGDFAFNARAALDHLAWELASSWTWRAVRERAKGKQWPPKLYFPIYAEFPKPRDKQVLKRKLSLFPPIERRLIANAQPHKRGKNARADPLWLLDQIRNVDAHRELHTVLPSVPPDAVGDLVHRVVAVGGASKLPDYLDMFDRPVTVNPGDTIQLTAKIEGNFAPLVTFDQPGADFDGQEVLPLLHRCRDEVERILGLF